jgi:GGDEF domain-containing protein
MTINERDSAAEERDSAANERERTDGLSIGEHEPAARDREGAARDRGRGSRDREVAAEDRKQAARDRAEAGVDVLTGVLRRGRGLIDLQREIDRASRSDGRLVLAFVDVEGARRRFDEVARNLTERSPKASVSVGLAVLADPDTLDELIARADAALYAGRRGTRAG